MPLSRCSILLVLLSALVIGFGCGSTTAPFREEGTLEGKIYVLGNDPFTRLALALDETHSVVLLCPPEIEKYLRSHQGESAKVTYKGTSRVPEGQAVNVIAAERMKE